MNKGLNSISILSSARQTLLQEAKAITDQIKYLNGDFEDAVRMIMTCSGKIVITGIGKSGIIGRKISATFASTGTPSFFLHPAEAFHGDLGMLSPDDVIVALSNSGETNEILEIIPFLKCTSNKIISITQNKNSTLAINSDIHIQIYVPREACPLNLAPTTSTTVMLAIGDALAIVLMKLRGFKPQDYAMYHPGGNLGKRLLTEVSELMIRENLPIVPPDANVKDVLFAITKSRVGIAVVQVEKSILGVITDGDIRRFIQREDDKAFTAHAGQIMTKNPITISPDSKLYEAEELMKKHKIHTLLVVTDEMLVGLIELYDLT